MSSLVWLVPCFPLAGFLILGLLNRSLPKSIAGIIGSGSVLASFIVAIMIFIEKKGSPSPTIVSLFDWISVGSFTAKMSFLVDPLSCLFMLVITGVGFLIHVYSMGYMDDDDGYRRFFAYLNLFVFFMLLLVLGDNYLVMFVGWEGVGLCSYLLIGFWFKNIDYSAAAKKAFVMNRIGDLGFLLGILMIFSWFGAVDYATVFSKVGGPNIPFTAITMLLFVGAMGKSAQIPLYTWLPDAMAGPTPVSALIHAATMVTAGIYMIARSSALFGHSAFTMDFIAIIGISTSLLAASIGLYQTDIKKVLAYSTVSQLGLMFVGLGVGAFTGAVFHVITHAFFKALLFLGAGSVIHAMSGEQDIKSMGGLRSKLPLTHPTFLIGTLAIAGIPPLSGFFSKDEILIHAWERSPILGVLGILVSLMTVFYMFRLYFLTFSGTFRGTHDQEHHLHESPTTMTFPLIILAIASVFGGILGLNEMFGLNQLFGPNFLHSFLTPVFGAMEVEGQIGQSAEWMFMGVVTLLVLAVIYMAYNTYVVKGIIPAANEAEMPTARKLIFNKYYVDELYDSAVTKPLNHVSGLLSHFIEKHGIDRGVNGIGSAVRSLSSTIRTAQNGNVDVYFFAMVLAIILVLAIKVL